MQQETSVVKAATIVEQQMRRLTKELPACVWLVALPQLISRATHGHKATQQATRKIITNVFVHYPDQVTPPTLE